MNVLRRNNVTILGQGKQVVLFAHGFGCDQNMWRYITPQFLTTHKLVLFDHVGAGNSDPAAYDSAKYNSLAGYADDIVEICRCLDLRDVIFIGHSVGAMMGILSAIKAPESFQKLVLIGPSPCYIDDQGYIGGFKRPDILEMLDFMEQDYREWSNTFAAFIMGNPERPSLGEELANSFCNTDSTIAKQFARVTFLADNRADLAKVQTKALVLQCTDDIIAPQEVGEYVSRTLQNGTLIKLRATGHCPNLSAPLETIAAMEAFMLA